jgi:hypothetical protein
VIAGKIAVNAGRTAAMSASRVWTTAGTSARIAGKIAI